MGLALLTMADQASPAQASQRPSILPGDRSVSGGDRNVCPVVQGAIEQTESSTGDTTELISHLSCLTSLGK